MSNPPSTTVANLANLPIELRNEVYDNSIEEITYLVLPRDFNGSILDYLLTRLPTALKTNKQFAPEAAMVYLRRTIKTATSIKVPNPSAFNLDLPENMKWEKVYELEFTAAQQYYARPADGFPKAMEGSSIQEIVARCPKLERLTFAIKDTMILPQYSNTIRNTATRRDLHPESMNPHIYKLRPDLFLVLDHQNINQVTLNVTNAILPKVNEYDYKYYDKLTWFTKEFEQEAKRAGRNINLTVELSPGVVKDPHESQVARHKKDGITWIQYYDFFG